MIKNKYCLLFLLIILIPASAFCQTENLKWQKADLSYQLPDNYRHREYTFDADDAGDFIKKLLANTYWFFISDADGDNCPFRPSCSSFLMDAIEETNIFQGTLMFFDRFTRDLNLSKGKNHYPRVRSGHYYDTALNYSLQVEKIYYIPPSHIVEE